MTSPSNPPFTHEEHPVNLKPREVYCEKCKYTIVSDLPGARCGDCNSKLITVIYDMVIGSSSAT